ncbi:MAG: hypothetical protein RH859_03055 [Longimicrobiales bacterium]
MRRSVPVRRSAQAAARALLAALPPTVVALAVAMAFAPSLSARQVPRLVHRADIGCAMCGGPDEFGTVLALAVGDGRIVVADRDDPHLRLFSLDGRALGTAGRDGQGPGEVQAPFQVTVHRDGMAVVDIRANRVLFTDLAGQERRTVRLPAFPLTAAFAPGGEALTVALADFRAMDADFAEWNGADGFETLREGVEELGLRPPGEMPLLFSMARAPGGGFAVGIGEEDYRLMLFDPSGALVRTVTRDIPRRTKTPAEIEAERERRRAARARMGAAGSPEGVPDERPVDPLHRHFGVEALRYDPTGRLWVRTNRGESDTVFDLFAAGGQHLGELRVPGRVRTFAPGDTVLAAEVLDEFDLATVRVWSVARGTP